MLDFDAYEKEKDASNDHIFEVIPEESVANVSIKAFKVPGNRLE